MRRVVHHHRLVCHAQWYADGVSVYHGASHHAHVRLDHEMLPENTMADAEKWAAGMEIPSYAMDDQTAIKVVDGVAEVISEGHWKKFGPHGA